MTRLSATIIFFIIAAAIANRCVPLSRIWHSTSEVSSLTEDTTSTCRIKGSIILNGERIYHIPGQPDYNETRVDTLKGERWFCTEAEARSAGWRKSHAN